ncbi:hypothetical protein [Methylobacterium sp.]|uniref:hypothetical protein n=1 Tax=Methylobacterium sp. TaxID=409 RepID=UPI003C791BEB
MAGKARCQKRKFTHEIFARWIDESGKYQSAQVGVRVRSYGENYEVINSQRFPMDSAVILAIPVNLRDVPHNAVHIERFRLEVVRSRTILRKLAQAMVQAKGAIGEAADRDALDEALSYLAENNTDS